jgi:N-acetylneuraminate synthase/N,N'-diacetyllegionaminate synthase
MFKRCELKREQLFLLKEECEKYNLNFHSTPTSLEGIQDLQEIGCTLLKNGSDYLTQLDLIRSMGETGLTTVLSTGMATLAEIDHAVRAFRETGNDKLILLHCTSSYPTPPEDVNLARLATLSSAFDVPVGFSDHSAGTTAAIGASILGSCWIEKHFTRDKNLSGPDHWFSMDPFELKGLVTAVRETEKMIGSSKITHTASEELGRRDFRLSCVAAKDIKQGTIITKADITYRRPGNGISPLDSNILIGLTILKSVKLGESFLKEHFHE